MTHLILTCIVCLLPITDGMPLHQLKFIEASAIKAVQMEGITLSSPACQERLESFRENMRLVSGITAAPGWAAMITMQWNMATNNAALEVWGQDWIHKMSKAPPHEVMRFNKLKHKMMAEIVAENDPLMRNHLIVMTNQTDELAWRCGKFVHGMLEGLLKAECIQAWTTYEVLLEDLHGAAIDENPKCFSQDTLDKRARQIANSKGSKFHFRKRDNFRDAYDFAFSSDEHINAAVCHEDINALAAVRHLLVHKSGYVDQSFIDELPTAPLLKRFGAIEKGKLLLFDGLVVCQIIDATVNQGYNLLRAVDAWLSRQLATIPNVP